MLLWVFRLCFHALLGRLCFRYIVKILYRVKKIELDALMVFPLCPTKACRSVSNELARAESSLRTSTTQLS